MLTETARPTYVLRWLALGGLAWAFLAQVAIDPGMFPATAALARTSWLLWSIRIVLPLLTGFALTRRNQRWPAVIILSSIAAALVLIDASGYAISAFNDFFSAGDSFIAAHHTDQWSVRYPDGPPARTSPIAVALGVVAGLVIAAVSWWACAGVLWLGIVARRAIRRRASTLVE